MKYHLCYYYYYYYYYYHTGKTTEWSPIQSVIMQHRTSVKLCKMQRYIDQLNSRKLLLLLLILVRGLSGVRFGL